LAAVLRAGALRAVVLRAVFFVARFTAPFLAATLRPTFFADWLVYPHFAKEIWANKQIVFPFGNGRHAPISTDDQGRVIANILTRPEGHGGNVYRLHGPREMDHEEIAAAMSEVLGTKI